MHECSDCGQACDCDGEDLWYDHAPKDCLCPCWIDEPDALFGEEGGRLTMNRLAGVAWWLLVVSGGGALLWWSR